MPSHMFEKFGTGRFSLMQSLPVVLVCVCALSARADSIADEPSVTPYRPSVSTPAALSAPGWLEIETGIAQARSRDEERRSAYSYAAKLAFNDDWGVRVQGEGWAQDRQGGGDTARGLGDTAVVIKHRMAIDDKSAFGLEGGVSFATSATGIGQTRSAALANAIYSADFGDYHTDLNLFMTRFAQADVTTGTSRNQLGYALALSKGLTEAWGVSGELSGTTRQGAPSTAQFQGAFSYSPRKSISFDFGAASGLTNASPRITIFAGVTFLAARMF